jgi:hypothetical protein
LKYLQVIFIRKTSGFIKKTCVEKPVSSPAI